LKVSVILSVFNAIPHLKDSLKSIFNQTFKDYEVIFVNDGSTDDSEKLLREYLDKPHVRLLKNINNEGIPISRNRALLIAKGEYIAIHDGDDISLETRLQKEVEYLDSHPDITFIGSYAYKMNQSGKVMGIMSYPPTETTEAFRVIKNYKLNPIIDSSCMYRKDIILSNGGYSMAPEMKTALDLHLWCRLLCKGNKMSNIQEPLIMYRINPNGVTQTQNKKMLETTENIVATFRRNNFEEVVLIPSFFKKDCYTEIWNNENGEKK
jgi:glycosyltransferase involved in cell wall biosynthesis